MAVWAATLRPASTGEARLVAAIGDAHFRLDRLALREHAHVVAALDSKVMESDQHKAVTKVRDALAGLRGLIELVGDVRPKSYEVRGITRSIRFVVTVVGEAGAPSDDVEAVQHDPARLGHGRLGLGDRLIQPVEDSAAHGPAADG